MFAVPSQELSFESQPVCDQSHLLTQPGPALLLPEEGSLLKDHCPYFLGLT